ncbi:hypothetical protein AAC387_Pa01g0624 [Persea americana]
MHMYLQSKCFREGKFAIPGSCGTAHCIDNGGPHNPGFPSKESVSKVRNCWACGILPTKRFCERFKTERNDRAVNSTGISPESQFIDKSNDSSCRRFPNDDDFREKRELARRNRWKVNSAWHELLLQKGQVGIERLDAAEARAAEWVVERDELRASLASKDAALAELTAKNVGLVFDLEESKVEADRLKDELEDEKGQNQHLSSELDDLRVAAKRLQDDLDSAKSTNRRLLSQRNQAQASLETALREKAAEIESALAKQGARLKEEFLAEHDSIMEEEVGRLSANYKAQLPGIRDRAWELGWKAALRKAGIPEDSPLFLDAPRFSCSDPGPAAVSQVSSDPSSQSFPEANSAPGAHPEALAEGCQVAAVVEVPPEAAVVVPETAPTAPEASAVAAEVPPEIDCNVEAAAL